jgi:hypothetical protein
MKRKLQTEIDREAVIGYIKRLDLKKLFTVEVTEKKPIRSISQNSLYWLWLTCIEFETGNERDTLHEYFKRTFLTVERVDIFGRIEDIYSTKKLNTVQFKYYLDHIQQFANTDLAINLPNPEDQYWDEFYKYYVDKL